MSKKKNQKNNKNNQQKAQAKTASTKAGAKPAKADSGSAQKSSKHAGAGKARRAAKYHAEEGIFTADLAAAFPGIMMVFMILIIFLIEILGRASTDAQVNIYLGAFRVCDYIAIAVGLVFLIYQGTHGNLRLGLTTLFGKGQKDGSIAPNVATRLDGVIELCFIAFMVCIIISTCINGLNHDAAFGLPVRYIGIFNMFAFFIIYMKVSSYIDKDFFRHIILIGFLLTADLIALTAFVNQYLTPVPAYQHKAGISAIFANSNHYGYFIGMAVVIGIGYWVYEQKKLAIIGLVSALLNLIMLVLNNTLGAQLAVGICVAVMTIMVVIFDRGDKLVLKKMLGTLAVFVICVIGATAVIPTVRTSIQILFADLGAILAGNTTGTEGSGRMMVWMRGVNYIKQHPVFGRGCEGITMEMYNNYGIGDVHSELLTFAIYYGIPAMLFYLAGVVMVAVRSFRNRKSLPATCRIAFLGASAYFLSSLVGVSMFYTTPFLYVFMGLMVSAGTDADAKQASRTTKKSE